MATYQVGADGKAQKGLSAGDEVVTAGGTYKITGVNADGSYVSSKVSDTTTKNYTGSYANKPSSGSSSGTTSSGTSSGGYVAKGSYNDANLSAADAQKVAALKQQYETAKAQGNKAGMDAAHSAAEAIRAQYGYSGGGDGSEYYGLEMEEGKIPMTGLPTYQAQTGAVNSLYDAANKASLAALESAYNNSKLEMKQAKGKISPMYQQQANLIAAEAAKQRMNFNEQAAASGMNVGTGSQARLAMNIQEQGDQAAIRTAEANAMQDAENKMTALYVEYQGKIATAVANNEYERAAQLLDEYRAAAQSVVDVAKDQAQLNLSYTQQNQSVANTNYDRLLSNAETLAKFGDFYGYLALGYTNDQIEQMRAVWKAANPDIAWAVS